MARKYEQEQEPVQQEAQEESFSPEEQERLLTLLRQQMTTDEITAAITRMRGSTVQKWDVQRAIEQLEAETKQADSVKSDPEAQALPDEDVQSADQDSEASEPVVEQEET